LAALLVFACAGAASAQATRSYPDTVGDNFMARAHDIRSVTISIDATQRITTRVNTSRADPTLQADDYIVLYIDADANPATGESGADYYIAVSGGSSSNAAEIYRWVGGAWAVCSTCPSFSGAWQASPEGMQASFAKSDLGIGSAFRFHAVSRWHGEAQYDDYVPDDAPAGARLTYDVVAPITVTKTGPGSGAVRSSPGGIDCGSSCSANFVLASSVTLQAFPDSATSDFAGWGGACSGTELACTLTVDDAKSVTAQFTLGSQRLVVGHSGRGSVRSSPKGISCGSKCRGTFRRGSVVKLAAIPLPGARFVRWGGCSSRGATCSVSMTTDRTVQARFKQYPHIALGWNYQVSGGTVRLVALPRPRAAISVRCLRGCAVLRRTAQSADISAGSSMTIELRATRRGFIGASRLISGPISKLVSAEARCIAPRGGRPVACSRLGVG
jgi:hypothetical protein